MPKQPASAKHVASNVSSYCAQATGNWPSLMIGIGMVNPDRFVWTTHVRWNVSTVYLPRSVPI